LAPTPAAPTCRLAPTPFPITAPSPVLGAGALVEGRVGSGTSIARLDDEGAVVGELGVLDPVAALEVIEDGFVLVTVGDAPALLRLDAEGAETTRVDLGGAAREAGLAVETDTAWIALRGDGDAVRALRVDLLSGRAGEAIDLGRGRGALLVSPGLVTWASAGAPVWTPGAPLEIPGIPRAVAGGVVIYGATDRTGLWPGSPPTRLTQRGVHPVEPRAAPLGDGLLLAYRSRGDLWLQPADPTHGPLGAPILVAPDATPLGLATRGERLWVAWRRGDAVEVRGGRCAFDG